MHLRSIMLITASALAFVRTASAGENSSNHEAYYGNYRVSENHIIGVSPFITDAGRACAFLR
jgi:hypothetical protein